MPPYGGFFMAVNPLQKHIFRGALKPSDSLVSAQPNAQDQRRVDAHLRI
jgi:hypothetical protein